MGTCFAQDCAWTSDPDTSCSANEKHPGLWEVPVWLLPNAAGENAFSMDPEAASAVSSSGNRRSECAAACCELCGRMP